MKLLFVSNLYPPHSIGGYEMLCEEVAIQLAARGHEIHVLSSDYTTNQHAAQDSRIERSLRLESNIYYYGPQQVLRYRTDRAHNLRVVRKTIARVKPEIVFVWGMWNLSKTVAAELERLAGERVVYYFANAWPIEISAHRAYWESSDGKPLGRLFKRAFRRPVRGLLESEWRLPDLRFAHTPCCSAATRAQIQAEGVRLGDAPVIYEGIDLRPFIQQARARQPDTAGERLDLVFVGTLVHHKGTHTAIEALAQLGQEPLPCEVTLTILGKGHPDYTAHLHELVRRHGLESRVTFRAPIPRHELPDFLGGFDVLLLPSIWEEPLARIMQDGLAAGLVLVATRTGGTKEILVDGENGLGFATDDPADLARQIRRLADDPAFRGRLRAEGVRTAVEKFDLERMVDEIEHYLVGVVADTVPPWGNSGS